MGKVSPSLLLIANCDTSMIKIIFTFNEHVLLTGSDEEFLEENNSVVKTYQAKRNKKNLSGTPKHRKTVTSSSKRNPYSGRAEVFMPKSPLRVSQSQTPIVSGTPPLTRSKAATATTGNSHSKNKEMSENIQPTLTPARYMRGREREGGREGE